MYHLYSCTKYVGGQNNTPCLGNHKIYEKEMEYLVFFCQQKKNTFLLANLCTENIKILILHILRVELIPFLLINSTGNGNREFYFRNEMTRFLSQAGSDYSNVLCFITYFICLLHKKTFGIPSGKRFP